MKRRLFCSDLGPSPRSRGTVGSGSYRVRHSSGGDGEDTERGEVVTNHSWLPAPLVVGVGLLLAPLDTR